MSHSIFEQSLNRHAALTQYYRWFQIYERPFTEQRIANQLSIFSNDILVESIGNTARGKKEYQDKLMTFSGTTNAHHVRETHVKQLNPDTLELTAEILYQGMKKSDDPVNNSVIRYQTTFSLQDKQLPLFTHLKLSYQGQGQSQPYHDAYAKNRAASLMHYWLYNMESQHKNPQLFAELLAEEFELNLNPTNTINQFSQFETWIKNVSASIKHSAHFEKNFSAHENTDGTITMKVNFDWQGVNSKDQAMIAATQHTWILENNPDEKFPRIKKMQVEQEVPFQVTD